MEISQNFNKLSINKLSAVKANLTTIFHFLTPQEEISLISSLKSKFMLNYLKAYDYQELISIMIRNFIYSRKFKNKTKSKKTNYNNSPNKSNFNYIFHILTNKRNMSQIFTSIITLKPFLIPFNIYKSINGKVDDLNRGFNSKTSDLIGLENKNVDVYLISNLERFMTLYSEGLIDDSKDTNFIQSKYWEIFKENQNYFENINQTGMSFIVELYRKLDKNKKIVIDNSDVRKLYNLNEFHSYFLKMAMKTINANISNNSNISNKTTLNSKEEFYDWNEFFNIQKYKNFYNSFFSYDYILINNADLILHSNSKDIDEYLAVFIHSNAELDTQDKELLDYFTDITSQKLLLNVVEKLKIKVINKKSEFSDSYVEFDTQASQENNNLKILFWVNLKMLRYHFIKLKPLYHYGRFIVIKLISCKTVPSFAFYGRMLEY